MGLLAGCVSLGASLAAASPAVSQNDLSASSPDWLRRDPTGLCRNIYQLVNTNFCTHGADPVPSAIQARGAPAPIAATTAAQTTGAVECDGDGQSGKRVQSLYVYVSGRENRRSAYLSSFRSWAATVDALFRESAAETGGSRRLRWVTNSDCLLAVPAVAVSTLAESNFATMISELSALGYNRSDRKYMVWFDSDPRNSTMCGIATVYADDKPTGNINDEATGYARADYACWNFSEPHELMHTLGGVQPTAPHATSGMHCTDEYDQMCYQDAPTSVMTVVCPADHDRLFDCGHDDYFSTSPLPGSYLASHWNTADSGWLVIDTVDTTPPVASPPRVSFVPGMTLSANATVRVAWDEAGDDSGIAAYELQRKKDAGSWVSVTLPDPRTTSVDLSLRVGSDYEFRVRARDGAGNTGPWAKSPAAKLKLLEENATTVAYTGTFKRQELTGASGGYVRHSSTTGDTASLNFAGTSVAFVSTVGPSRGMATVRLDGGAMETLDFYASGLQTRQVIWTANAGAGTHTLELTVTGAQNPSSSSARVDVDAFLVWKPVP